MTTPLLTCPHCGESFAAEAVSQGRDLAEYMSIIDSFGTYACTVRDYIGLFKARPDSKQKLSAKLKVARELSVLWRNAEFSFNRVAYQIGRPEIANALHDTVQAMAGKCGLKNHNYLKKVMLDDARRQAANKEKHEDQARKAGFGRDNQAARQTRQQPAPEEEDMRPLWELPLEIQAEGYARITSNRMMASALSDTVRNLGRNLSKAGLDLERLTREGCKAKDSKELVGKGPELLRRCRTDAGPAPLAECLPPMDKGENDG
jgi:hypothetical protein